MDYMGLDNHHFSKRKIEKGELLPLDSVSVDSEPSRV